MGGWRMEQERTSLSKFIYNNFSSYEYKIAMKYENNQITYLGLLQKAKHIACFLQITNISKVGICIGNKMDTMILALGCIFQGVPFIILDKNNPTTFSEEILLEADIPIVIVDDRMKVNNIQQITYSSMQLIDNCKNAKLSLSQEDHVVFYIATSGSTGKPKVAERYLSSFWQDYLEIKNGFSYLFNQIAQQYAKLNFSYGFENSLILLIGGTTLCFSSNSSSVQDIQEMYKEIEANKASVVFWSTPIIKLLSKHPRLYENFPGTIKYIYTGGEPLIISADFVVDMHNREITLLNDYGCSEIGKVFTKTFEIELRDMQAYNMVGVGEPLKGYEALVLDDDYNEVEEGFLYLKSKTSFPCSYANKTLVTNEIKVDKFDGCWLYNTHDIAKKTNNNIYILGREINSVNVAGYRVELEQVEYSINRMNEINLCVVIPRYNNYREANLFCFYSGELNNQQIRGQLQKIIPSYMIPTSFISVENIFLLPNGKVDRKKNNEIYGSILHQTSVDVGGIKERISNCLKNIIGSKLEGIDDIYLKPFSDYGLDSLSVVDFISTVEEQEKVLIIGDSVGTYIKCMKDIVDIVSDRKREEKWI